MADRFDDVVEELRGFREEMRTDRAEMRREFASWRAHIDRLQEQTDENLRFLREVNRRGELALQQLVRSQGVMREDIRAETRQLGILSQQTEASTQQMRTLTQQTEAQTRQINTQTRSIFALADRLEGGGGRSPAT